jgi:PAS domain S-box-containing protein
MNDKTNKHPRTAALLFNDNSDDQSLTATASHENLGQRLADAEAALEQAGVGCWDWQIGTEHVAWTAVMERLWGMEPGEFQGTLDEVAEPIFAEDLERWQESVQRAIEQGVEHRIEMRIAHKDGSVRWIEAIGNVIRDEQGTPVRMMGTAMDVTERKTAELSLHDSEAANSAFLQAIPDLIFRLDKNGVHKDYFIPEAEESFTSADKIIGSTVHELLPADVAALYVKSIQECLDHRATEIFEYSLQFENKELKDFEARMVPFGRNEVMVLVRNVTEHKQAEREKEHLHEQLAQSQKMESIGRLAGGVAHDFNNLLQAILGNAELLRLKLSHDKKLRCHVEQILSTGQRSAELTRQLLAFARKQTVAPVHADLNELIERTLNMLRRLIGEHISVHWHPYPAPLPVLVDTAQMDQIVTNVMLNARDALGAIGNITVQTSIVEVGSDESAHADLARGRYACLKITDDGEGMSESILERVFEPFFTTKKIGEGTGLGLAMVYGAVKQNRGEVAITSTQGKGTQVEINLPL